MGARGSCPYFPTDCFGGSSNVEGTGSTLFSGKLFWKFGSNLEETGSTLFSGGLFWKFGGNWLHIIFRRIVSEAAQIRQELAPHYFLVDCFGGSSNLALPKNIAHTFHFSKHEIW